MKVTIWTKRRGEDHVAGVFTFDGQTLSHQHGTDPRDQAVMQYIVEESVRDVETGELLTSDAQPAKWLENLRYTYKSTYLRATAPAD